MAKLVAYWVSGPSKKQVEKWTKVLTPGRMVSLGRTDKSDWIAEWEQSLSRRHAELRYESQQLSIDVLHDATNALDFEGKSYPGGSRFTVRPGQRFTLHETIVEFQDDAPTLPVEGPTPTESKTVRVQDLRSILFPDANKQVDAIANFHDAIREIHEPSLLDAELLKTLLKGIPTAEVLAIAAMPPRDAASSEISILGTLFRNPTDNEFHPSRKLIVEAIHTFKEPRIHTWSSQSSGNFLAEGSGLGTPSKYDWAFCVPCSQVGGDRIGIYVTGHDAPNLSGNESAQDEAIGRDLKFAELVSKIYTSYRKSVTLQKRNDTLSRFLSRSVRQVLLRGDISEVLKVRETTVTVLFCDLRGSCKIAEDSQDDLPGLWERISRALSLMTGAIVDQDGVIGDFQGDAAMGFWGWPIEQSDQVQRAARAALSIRRSFAAASSHPGSPLAGFNCGVGIAHGRAIAGALGTAEQFKISVYGPTVNLASRLESLTKFFKVPILVDEAAAAQLEGTPYAFRRLSKIRPYGLIHPITVGELFDVDTSMTIEIDTLENFDVGLEHFIAGNWSQTQRKLAHMQHDGPSQVILDFIKANPSGPPKGWDGVIPLKSK
jgi:adenylate cyclase